MPYSHSFTAYSCCKFTRKSKLCKHTGLVTYIFTDLLLVMRFTILMVIVQSEFKICAMASM